MTSTTGKFCGSRVQTKGACGLRGRQSARTEAHTRGSKGEEGAALGKGLFGLQRTSEEVLKKGQ